MASLSVLEPFTLLSPYSTLEIRPEAKTFCGSCKGHSFTTEVKHEFVARPASARTSSVTLGKFWGFVSKSDPS